LIAFSGQARAQSPQPRQTAGFGMGISPGFSCRKTFILQACTAAHKPPLHFSGQHLAKVTIAILPGILSPRGTHYPEIYPQPDET